MKRKILYSILIGVILLMLNFSLFFCNSIENFFLLKPNLSKIDESAFEVHFIDVGQGDAVAIRFPNEKTMLVDSGPASGKENLQEYLENVFFEDNYDTFDYVFLTHSDIDHSGNMNYILENFEVKNFFRPKIFSLNLESNQNGFKENNACYDEILLTLSEKSITTFFCTDGGLIEVGDSTIEIYTYSDIDSIKETNEFSPTLIITSNNKKVYLSGDAGEKVEKDLIERNVLCEVDLFKLAHHGSKYSNTQELINTISPEYVTCCVGDNSYGHPTSEVMLRLAKFDKENSETTCLTFKNTLDDGNIIYFANLRTEGEMYLTTISNLGDYIFMDWWVIVVITDIVLVGILLFIVISKKRIKLNIHMKNMKA